MQHFKKTDWKKFILQGVLPCLLAVAVGFISRYQLELSDGVTESFLQLQWPLYAPLNALTAFCLTLILFALCGRWSLSTGLSGAVFTIIALINYYTRDLHGSALMPQDILNLGTAAEVMGSYTLKITQDVVNKLGHEVMAVDENEDRVNAVLSIVTNAQIGDSTNAEFLEALGVRNFDVCIVAISGNFQSSLETTSLLKELGAKMVVSRAERDVQAKFLLRNGADEVLYPEKQLAKWAAIRYGSDHVLDYIELDHDHAILEVSVPSAWIGKTVGDINIRKKYSINILGIKRNGIADVNIDSDTVLPGDGTLLVLGEGKALSRCFHI